MPPTPHHHHAPTDWHVYRKWNEKLFHEMYEIYATDRMHENTPSDDNAQSNNKSNDPATSWYENELKFFDDVVIPIAQKMVRCEVFGNASNECLSYAISNRDEWQMRGKQIVDEMVQRYHDFVAADDGRQDSTDSITMQ
mmetsp:Transcript_14254/g.39291  ORF Transcript_14254/g.39291 Transcript_14254/m.39291 type:complete len:139 (-) Transcript_14254:97-513(-)